MKKIVSSLLISAAMLTPLCAEIYTGTSVTAGVSTYGTHIRLDQYIGSSEYQWVYAKVGVSKEALNYNDGMNAAWGCATDSCESADQNSPLDNDIISLVVGVGFNLLNYNNFFIDTSLDYYFDVDSQDIVGKTVPNHQDDGTIGTDTILSHGSFNSPAVELGAGYSLGNWSFRADLNYLFVTPDVTIGHADSTGTTYEQQNEKFDPRVYIGLGVTYWY